MWVGPCPDPFSLHAGARVRVRMRGREGRGQAVPGQARSGVQHRRSPRSARPVPLRQDDGRPLHDRRLELRARIARDQHPHARAARGAGRKRRTRHRIGQRARAPAEPRRLGDAAADGRSARARAQAARVRRPRRLRIRRWATCSARRRWRAGRPPQPDPPGTHWYHPHAHGSTHDQVSAGMAGFLIVEGDVDDAINTAMTGERAPGPGDADRRARLPRAARLHPARHRPVGRTSMRRAAAASDSSPAPVPPEGIPQPDRDVHAAGRGRTLARAQRAAWTAAASSA